MVKIIRPPSSYSYTSSSSPITTPTISMIYHILLILPYPKKNPHPFISLIIFYQLFFFNNQSGLHLFPLYFLLFVSLLPFSQPSRIPKNFILSLKLSIFKCWRDSV